MKKSIHPKLTKIKITDGSGNTFEVLSTLSKDITLSASKETHMAWTKRIYSSSANKSAKIRHLESIY